MTISPVKIKTPIYGVDERSDPKRDLPKPSSYQLLDSFQRSAKNLVATNNVPVRSKEERFQILNLERFKKVDALVKELVSAKEDIERNVNLLNIRSPVEIETEIKFVVKQINVERAKSGLPDYSGIPVTDSGNKFLKTKEFVYEGLVKGAKKRYRDYERRRDLALELGKEKSAQHLEGQMKNLINSAERNRFLMEETYFLRTKMQVIEPNQERKPLGA